MWNLQQNRLQNRVKHDNTLFLRQNQTENSICINILGFIKHLYSCNDCRSIELFIELIIIKFIGKQNNSFTQSACIKYSEKRKIQNRLRIFFINWIFPELLNKNQNKWQNHVCQVRNYWNCHWVEIRTAQKYFWQNCDFLLFLQVYFGKRHFNRFGATNWIEKLKGTQPEILVLQTNFLNSIRKDKRHF